MGVLLGTPAYMSPEQARGSPVDKRTDIWAFGCVLFEMLAGTRAIEGESLSDTLANVLKGQPDWSALPPSVPPRIRTFVQRCLEKDRSRRVADASTLAYITDEALESESDTGGISPAIARIEGVRRWAMPLSLIAFVAILVAGIAVWSLRHSLPAPGIMRFAHLDL
jgi:serine/threonine protein kinase